MNIIATDCGDYTRLMVEGRVDTNTSPQFQEAILNTYQKSKNVVIDFLNVVYISSAGLRALLIGKKTSDAKGGTFKLTNINDTVKSVLDMSGFSKIIDIV